MIENTRPLTLDIVSSNYEDLPERIRIMNSGENGHHFSLCHHDNDDDELLLSLLLSPKVNKYG
jgi:hypothetical protein